MKGGRRAENWFLLTIACIAIVFMLIALIGPLKEMDTLIKVTPSKTKLVANEQFTVAISIEPAAGVNVAGAQFDLAFNAQCMRIDSVVEGNFLKQNGNQTYFMGGTITDGLIKNVAGCVLGAGANVTTKGDFVILNCTALTQGQASAMILSNVVVGNMDGVALPLAQVAITQVQVVSAWDLNSDGSVDESDMSLVIAVFGLTGIAGWRREDLIADGEINVLDMISIGQNYT